MDLSGAVCVVTGASSGIGAAIAEELSNAGAKLVLTARREERLHAVARRCRHTKCIAADILDQALPQRLIDTAITEYGRCDIVCNNAGMMEVGAIDKIDLERICHMVRVNVEAAFRMAYVAIRHFRAAGRGHLVNTSSILGTKTRPTTGAYAGTKYAIEALSESLRMELAGTNVKVSCIEPGLVLTELHSHWEVPPAVALNIPHALTPQDVARSVRFIIEQPDHVNIPRLMIMPTEHQL
jgi:NADP-dependent 3-hydroxy acid dehydrogenase YdfG